MDETRAPRVVVGVSGGIAAYKACEVVRGLQKAGVEVRVAMSEAALNFMGATTFAALTGVEVAVDDFRWGPSAIPHVELGRWADCLCMVPATANLLAEMACGLAPDLLSSTALAMDGPTVVAPAMNVHMWEHPATQTNLHTLEARGVTIVAPTQGRLACGDQGTGKLAAPEEVVAAVLSVLGRGSDTDPQGAVPAVEKDAAQGGGTLAGKRVVVTAGTTHEPIDPVRYLANGSSGKMGYAIARALRDLGAEVDLVSGPVSLEVPEGVHPIDVVTAAQMHDAALAAFEGAHGAICAAAVADYTPAAPADHKLKKSSEPLESIALVPTADILADLCAVKGDRPVFGFAAETNNLEANAQAKLRSKGCDLVVANDVSRADSTFGSDTDAVTLVDASGTDELPLMAKEDVARVIAARLAEKLMNIPS